MSDCRHCKNGWFQDQRFGQDVECVNGVLIDIDVALDALRARVKALEGALARNCDGKEQEAFEAWAKAQGYNMDEHPLHYLFLDPKTDAARMGWNAAITYAHKQARQALAAGGADV